LLLQLAHVVSQFLKRGKRISWLSCLDGVQHVDDLLVVLVDLGHLRKQLDFAIFELDEFLRGVNLVQTFEKLIRKCFDPVDELRLDTEEYLTNVCLPLLDHIDVWLSCHD
jgi:hypothetical protein